MFKRMLAALLVAALAGMLACACAEGTEIRRGAYIQYEDGSVAVYAADGTLLYPAGTLAGAWRSVDQLIHFQKVIDGDIGEGVLDNDGNVIVQPEWDWTKGYVDGRICVFKSDEDDVTAGVLDEQGREVTGMAWDYLGRYCNGYAAAYAEGSGWGVIDRSGRIVVDPVWRQIEAASGDNAFGEGIALMSTEDNEIALLSLVTGEIIAEPQFRFFFGHRGFFDGMAIDEVFSEETGRFRYGFFNTAGELVIPLEYDYARDFCGGYATAGYEIGQWFVIDKEGTRVCELPKCDVAEVAAPGYVIAKTDAPRSQYDGKPLGQDRYRLYRVEGRQAIPLGGEWAKINAVDACDGRIRFVAKALALEEDVAGSLAEDVETSAVEREQTYLLDGDGVPLNGEGVASIQIQEGLALISKNGKYGFVDLDFNAVIPADYDEAEHFFNARTILRRANGRNSTYWLADTEGAVREIPWDDGGDTQTAMKNLAEYYGCARGSTWDF